MAKMRVHELAKELNIKSQDVLNVLSTTEYAVKSASSNVEDAAQEIVRKQYPAASAAKAPASPAAKRALSTARP